MVRTSKELPGWLAEQELDQNIDYWLPFIAGITIIPAEEVELMTGRQRSVLNAAAIRRIKISKGGGLGDR